MCKDKSSGHPSIRLKKPQASRRHDSMPLPTVVGGRHILNFIKNKSKKGIKSKTKNTKKSRKITRKKRRNKTKK